MGVRGCSRDQGCCSTRLRRPSPSPLPTLLESALPGVGVFEVSRVVGTSVLTIERRHRTLLDGSASAIGPHGGGRGGRDPARPSAKREADQQVVTSLGSERPAHGGSRCCRRGRRPAPERHGPAYGAARTAQRHGGPTGRGRPCGRLRGRRRAVTDNACTICRRRTPVRLLIVFVDGRVTLDRACPGCLRR